MYKLDDSIINCFLIFFVAPPTFLSQLQDAVIAPGNTVIIRCEIIGDPTPIVTWTKQGSELPHDRSV